MNGAIVGAMLGVMQMAAGHVPPPVPVAPVAPEPRLQRWLPGDARCGAVTLPASQARRPYTTLRWGEQPSPPRAYRFRIGPTGRPFAIVSDATMWDGTTTDIAPSLAASRFDTAGPLDGCTITYTADPRPLAEAPVGDLVSYSLNALSGPLPEAGWSRIRPPGGDCNKEPRAQWLRQVSPDYRKLPGEPGARDWSLVSYDLDKDGKPRSIRLAYGTGNAALDRAALKALAGSRQTLGPRHGCLSPYVRYASRLPAPADVDPATFRPDGANCPRDMAWERKPVLSYPASWRKRSIEGWAIVTFDVAPWGATGKVKAVASEPSSEFGQAAVGIISAATKAVSATGFTGCVERVRFVMGPGVNEPDGTVPTGG